MVRASTGSSLITNISCGMDLQVLRCGFAILIQDLTDDTAWLETGFNEFRHASVSCLCGFRNGPVLHRKVFRRHPVLVLGDGASDVSNLDDVIHVVTITLDAVNVSRLLKR